VNAAAAYHKYRRDLIVVDFGTATTFCAITAEGHYLGGVIAPGLGISAEALFARAAKLAKVELIRPKTVIGIDTAGSIQSGLLFGYAGTGRYRRPANGTGTRTFRLCHRHRRTQFHPGS